MDQPHYPPIQIVNDRDEPVGGESMENAYATGLIHRIVYVMVSDHEGNILLQKRSAYVATYPNCWDVSVGGHVDLGESYEMAALRELQEELGISGKKLKQRGKFYSEISAGDLKLKRYIQVFLLEVDHDRPFVLSKEEITEVRWMTVAEVKKLAKEQPEIVADGLVECLNEYY